MVSLPAQFFNTSFPLHLRISEQDEVQKTPRTISVNRQSEAEKKKECVFLRLSVGSVCVSVDETKWPREGMFIHLQLIISWLNTHPEKLVVWRISLSDTCSPVQGGGSCYSWRSNAPGNPVTARATMPYICPCGYKQDDLNSIPGRAYNKLSTSRIILVPIPIKPGTGDLY